MFVVERTAFEACLQAYTWMYQVLILMRVSLQVFVSSDKDDNTFRSYFSKMPWLGLPYKQRSIKQKLAKKFGVTVRASKFLHCTVSYWPTL
eukprot:COSAG02_NODE_6963_length_3260_cov_3.294843_2_plen_91_part_00